MDRDLARRTRSNESAIEVLYLGLALFFLSVALRDDSALVKAMGVILVVSTVVLHALGKWKRHLERKVERMERGERGQA